MVIKSISMKLTRRNNQDASRRRPTHQWPSQKPSHVSTKWRLVPKPLCRLKTNISYSCGRKWSKIVVGTNSGNSTSRQPRQSNRSVHPNAPNLRPQYLLIAHTADPDRSNPTRSRWERPLDTIRSFEAAIDGNYSRKSYMRSGQTP